MGNIVQKCIGCCTCQSSTYRILIIGNGEHPKKLFENLTNKKVTSDNVEHNEGEIDLGKTHIILCVITGPQDLSLWRMQIKHSIGVIYAMGMNDKEIMKKDLEILEKDLNGRSVIAFVESATPYIGDGICGVNYDDQAGIGAGLGELIGKIKDSHY